MPAPAEVPTTVAVVGGTALAVAVALPFWAWVGAAFVGLGAVGLIRKVT